MKRQEFLEKLREALSNGLDSRTVHENVMYYQSYIAEEMEKGRSEEEVIDELGDPWVLARSVIDMAENFPGNHGSDSVYNTGNAGRREEGFERGAENMHIFSVDSWWKKLIFILGIIGIVLIVMIVIGGLFRLFIPLIIPILVVALLFRIVNRRR